MDHGVSGCFGTSLAPTSVAEQFGGGLSLSSICTNTLVSRAERLS